MNILKKPEVCAYCNLDVAAWRVTRGPYVYCRAHCANAAATQRVEHHHQSTIERSH